MHQYTTNAPYNPARQTFSPRVFIIESYPLPHLSDQVRLSTLHHALWLQQQASRRRTPQLKVEEKTNPSLVEQAMPHSKKEEAYSSTSFLVQLLFLVIHMIQITLTIILPGTAIIAQAGIWIVRLAIILLQVPKATDKLSAHGHCLGIRLHCASLPLLCPSCKSCPLTLRSAIHTDCCLTAAQLRRPALDHAGHSGTPADTCP